MAVKGQPVVEEATIPCKEAKDALTHAIVSLFCFGIILGPMAISKGLKAKKMIEANPRLTGSGKATAAIIIGVVALVLWIIGIFAKVANIDK
jgi:uncharacterized Tic20 family protein